MDPETAADTGLSSEDKLKREMFEIMDRLPSEIDGRSQHLKSVNELQLNNRRVC